MAHLIDLPTFSQASGTLTVVEKLLPFEIKRFYYIYDIKSKRGGHRHKKTTQAIICLNGNCEIYLNNGLLEKTIILDKPNKCLIIEKEDWHTIDNSSNGSVLLVLSSEYYDKEDYIDEEYPK